MKKIFSCLAVVAVCSFNVVMVDEVSASSAGAKIGFDYEVTTISLDGGSAPMIIWDDYASGGYQMQIDSYGNYGYFDPTQNADIGINVNGNAVTMKIIDGVSVAGFEADNFINYMYLHMQVNRGFHVEGNGLLVLSAPASASYGFSEVWGNAYANIGIYDNSGDGVYSSASASIEARLDGDFKSHDLGLAFLVEDGRYYMATSYNSLNVSGPIAPVPVPGAAWLLGIGFVGIVGLKRQRLS